MENQNTGENQATPPVAKEVDTTKAFSERLKAAREADRAELAKAMGHDSWDSMLNSGINKKLLDAGIEPDTVKPVLDDVLSNHPDVVRARELITEMDKQKKELELQQLNQKFGTQFTSVDELDDSTRALMNKGISLTQAYVASNFDSLSTKPAQQDPARVAQAQKSLSTQHLRPVPGTGQGTSSDIALTQADIDNVRRFNPKATLEQIKEFVAKNPGIIK